MTLHHLLTELVSHREEGWRDYYTRKAYLYDDKKGEIVVRTVEEMTSAYPNQSGYSNVIDETRVPPHTVADNVRARLRKDGFDK